MTPSNHHQERETLVAKTLRSPEIGSCSDEAAIDHTPWTSDIAYPPSVHNPLTSSLYSQRGNRYPLNPRSDGTLTSVPPASTSQTLTRTRHTLEEARRSALEIILGILNISVPLPPNTSQSQQAPTLPLPNTASPVSGGHRQKLVQYFTYSLWILAVLTTIGVHFIGYR